MLYWYFRFKHFNVIIVHTASYNEDQFKRWESYLYIFTVVQKNGNCLL